MRSLAAPDWNAFDDGYATIVDRSHRPAKDTRTAVREQVREQYQKYKALAPHLETLRPNLDLSRNHTQHIRSCYSHTYMAEVKERILDLQRKRAPYLATHCQLCSSMNLAKEWDHYLPQAPFPELSACAYNIVYCCHDCNDTRKTTEWIVDVPRSMLHLYYDPIREDVSYLRAEIRLDEGVPEVCFEPHMSQDGDVNSFEAYARHFQTLELGRRFGEFYGLELLRLGHRIADYWASGLEQHEIVGALMAAARREPAGQNSPLAALHRAAADNQEFLDYTRAGATR